MDIYSETILEHYKHPRCKGGLCDYSKRVVEHNPLCGDTLVLDIKFDGGLIEDVSFSGEGCAISQASMSMICEHIKGMSKKNAMAIIREDVYDMLGVEIGPARVKCALLGFVALQKILNEES